MCRLLGLAFNQPIDPSVYFYKLLKQSGENPHGWGLASYKGGSARIFKEPSKGDTSELARFLCAYHGMRSPLHIAHIRKTGKLAVSYPNTHPFSRELRGKEFVFAHNGNVMTIKAVNSGRFSPVGSTDSEHAFCYLLGRLETRAIAQWSADHFLWLRNTLREMNKHGGLSCLFSDGEHLFCYRDKNGRSGLHFIHCTPSPGDAVSSEDSPALPDADDKLQQLTGYVIASEPLTGSAWEACHPSELVVINRGTMVYSSAGRLTA